MDTATRAVDEPHQGGESFENATGIPGAMGVGGKSNLSLIMKCLIFIPIRFDTVDGKKSGIHQLRLVVFSHDLQGILYLQTVLGLGISGCHQQ